MNKDAVEAGITALAPWFHQVELPQGLLTKTESHFGEDANHPVPTWQKVQQAFPESLDGKTVLDVGCNAGFYAFKALEHGAKSVLGLDAVRWQVQQARFAAKAKGVANAEFKRASIYELDPQKHGTFDVVLALGLVYHLKHLIAGLERLFTVTDELLIIESAVISPEDFACGKAEPVKRASDELYLLGYPKNSPWVKESAFNWFFPTADALRAMVEDVGFVDVEIVDVFFNRCLISARKPKEVVDSQYPAFLRAGITAAQKDFKAVAGESIEIPLRIQNTGAAVWRAARSDVAKGAVRLTAKLYSEDDPVFGENIDGCALGKDLLPGEFWDTKISFVAPHVGGLFTLEIDLVSEQVASFQDVGSPPLELPINVLR